MAAPQDGSGHRNVKQPGPSLMDVLIYPKEEKQMISKIKEMEVEVLFSGKKTYL